MKRINVAVMGAALLVLAQGAWAEGPAGERMRGKDGEGRGKLSREQILNRLIFNEQFAKEAGISEAQIQTLKDAQKQAKLDAIDLEAKLQKAGVKQAELLSAATIDEGALMQAVEETGKIRTELAKQRIKQIVLIKKTLTPEQIQKLKEIGKREMKAKLREGGQERGKRGAGEGHRMKDPGCGERPAGETAPTPPAETGE